MSTAKTLNGIVDHFVLTMALLIAETLVELFLRWNPSAMEAATLDSIITITNWFLVATISQFCLIAFLLLLINSFDELRKSWKDFRAK